MADELRRLLLAYKPNHGIGTGATADGKWPTSARRENWARTFDTMRRADKRDWRRSALLLRWVCSAEQRDSEYAMEVESAKALREKWDRIDEKYARAKGERSVKPAGTGAEDPYRGLEIVQ